MKKVVIAAIRVASEQCYLVASGKRRSDGEWIQDPHRANLSFLDQETGLQHETGSHALKKNFPPPSGSRRRLSGCYHHRGLLNCTGFQPFRGPFSAASTL